MTELMTAGYADSFRLSSWRSLPRRILSFPYVQLLTALLFPSACRQVVRANPNPVLLLQYLADNQYEWTVRVNSPHIPLLIKIL